MFPTTLQKVGKSESEFDNFCQAAQKITALIPTV
jgi:hypothetical protein